MNSKTSLVLTIVTALLCGLPEILSAVVGFLITVLGLLTDKAQLKLDTNLDKASVIWSGLGGICLGVVLIAIPIVVWFWTRRR
jgi:hypothetical protein